MRKYQPMWIQLRDHDHLQVNSPRHTHKTIISGIRKESHKDKGFKFKCMENNRTYEIRIAQVGDIIYFHLEWRDGLGQWRFRR